MIATNPKYVVAYDHEFGLPWAAHVAPPLSKWTPEKGAVLWWAFSDVPTDEKGFCQVVAGPWLGVPTDAGWSDTFTHWTPVQVPGRPDDGKAFIVEGKGH